MVLNKADLLARVQTYIGERDDDDTISFLEDVNDSINSLSDSSNEDWKAKYEQNDADWRKKYRDRFFNGGNDENNDDDFEEDKPLTFDNLFTKE